MDMKIECVTFFSTTKKNQIQEVKTYIRCLKCKYKEGLNIFICLPSDAEEIKKPAKARK